MGARRKNIYLLFLAIGLLILTMMFIKKFDGPSFTIGKYKSVVDKKSAESFIEFKDDASFIFTRNIAVSANLVGKYRIEKDRIILNSETDDTMFTFKILDKEKIQIDLESSSESARSQVERLVEDKTIYQLEK